MIKAKIHDIKMFSVLLNTISKFTKLCQFDLSSEGIAVYLKNIMEFSSAKLILKSNVFTISDKNVSKDEPVKICLKNVIALKSAIDIITSIKEMDEVQEEPSDKKQKAKKQPVSSIDLMLFETRGDDSLIEKIVYSNSEGSFELNTVDPNTVESAKTTDVKTKFTPDCVFEINARNLDILQNKTNAVIGDTEVRPHIEYSEDKKIMMSLRIKKDDKNFRNTNRISLPLTDKYEGALKYPNGMDSIVIDDSSFRIMNILKATDGIKCSILNKYNALMVESSIHSDEMFITSLVLIQFVGE